MKILYLGSQSGTCLDRANALRRLGHAIDHVDLRGMLPATLWTERLTYRLGGDWFSAWIVRELPHRLSDCNYDLCYVDGGEWVTPKIIAMLRKHTKKVINYNIDDPLGPRDGARSRAYRQCLPLYDLCVVMRSVNVDEALSLGARDVMRVWMTADEISHRPRDLSADDHKLWDEDALFMGTWFPERGPFLLHVIRGGIPLAIRGASWHKAKEWKLLKPHWKGGPLFGDDYAKAIQCAKVNLGLLSKGNRDMHTTRSAEIPALGGLLCAERTSEHQAMFEEGKEAFLWRTADECIEVCRIALASAAIREAVAAAGHARILTNGQYNEVVLDRIISRAFPSGPSVA